MFNFDFISHHTSYFAPTFLMWYDYLQQKNNILFIPYPLSHMGPGPLLIINRPGLRDHFLAYYGLGYVLLGPKFFLLFFFTWPLPLVLLKVTSEYLKDIKCANWLQNSFINKCKKQYIYFFEDSKNNNLSCAIVSTFIFSFFWWKVWTLGQKSLNLKKRIFSPYPPQKKIFSFLSISFVFHF